MEEIIMKPKGFDVPNKGLDDLFHSVDSPLPSFSMNQDPKYFLSVNKQALVEQLTESKKAQQKIVVGRFTAVFSLIIAVTMVFSLSLDARAFMSETFSSVIEWFSPDTQKSGVSFVIENQMTLCEPTATDSQPESNIRFSQLSETDKLYSHDFYVLTDASLAFKGGVVQGNSIRLNYKSKSGSILLMSEPVQQKGMISIEFNSDYRKIKTRIGDLYYELKDGSLFGTIMANDTSIMLKANGIQEEEMKRIIDTISSYR